MSLQSVEQLSFDFFSHLPVIVQRHAGQLSSDAGLLPLRQFDQRWNYTERLGLFGGIAFVLMAFLGIMPGLICTGGLLVWLIVVACGGWKTN